MKVLSEREGDVHTIALAGELDMAGAGRVEQELKRVEATCSAAEEQQATTIPNAVDD